MTLPAFMAGAALVLSSCSTSGSTSATDSEAEALLQRLRASYAATPTMNMTGTMKISGVPATIWFDALARSRDSLKIGLTGPFGIVVGAMAATPESFLFFNAQEGTAYEGRPDRATFAKIMMIDMDYQQMVSMIRGELPHVPAAGEYTAERLSGMIRYTVDNGSSSESFTLDPETLAAIDYRRWQNSRGAERTEMSIRFSSYIRVGERAVPRKAAIEINDGEQKIALDVDKAVDSIGQDRSLVVELPPGTPRKRI